ncbi:hypothetical protein CMV_030415 [Castanea mollissima]|uniref:Vacuolar-processing enzyme n=1 Tax=Castanea mollissima TaxID=60419 RepID=A0A8J4VCE1_9ROSI|nr:hypothetical protein CMV_030415 [Castanea mollissima]
MTMRHSLRLMSPPTLLILVLLGFEVIGGGRASRLNRWESGVRMPTEKDDAEDFDGEVGTRWAVLVAGSSGYGNYRHQADICHAYQLLKKDGLKEENIVVFMYDDIANNELNPRPGIIINHPQGSDVYAGVPKVPFNFLSIDNMDIEYSLPYRIMVLM